MTVGILHSVTGTNQIKCDRETCSLRPKSSLSNRSLHLRRVSPQISCAGRRARDCYLLFRRRSSCAPTMRPVMGWLTSASRQAVLRIMFGIHGMLYYHLSIGLGNPERHVHRPGATQQIIAGRRLGQQDKSAKTFYLLGSDYYGRAPHKSSRKPGEGHLRAAGRLRGILPARQHPVRLFHHRAKLNQARRDLRLIVVGDRTSRLQAATRRHRPGRARRG